MNTVSCIIPAYNESERIGKVLESVHNHPLITEIVVVDDGSADVEKTREIVSHFSGVRFIANPVNQGKSKNLYIGLQQATGEFLFLLDADLIGITSEDITRLIEPTLTGKVDMTISMRKNSPWIDRKLGIDFISGERVFHCRVLDGHMEEIPKLSRFGFETFLNTIIIKKQYSLAIVFWPEVISPYPIPKNGFYAGFIGQTKMIFDIVSVVPFYKIPYLFYKMKKLIKIPHTE